MDVIDYVPPPQDDYDARKEASIKALIEQREYIFAKMRENSLINFTKLVNHDGTKTPIYDSRAVKNFT